MARSLHRQLNLLDYAVGSLRRKSLKNIGVFLVFALVIFFLASIQLVYSGLREVSEKVLQAAPDITIQQLSAGRQVHLPIQAKQSLEGIYGISRVRERIWGYYFDESNGANYTVLGVNHEQEDFAEMEMFLSSGKWPEAGEKGWAVLGGGVQESLALADRVNFSLFRPDLSLISFAKKGVFGNENAMLTSDFMLIHIDDARSLFAVPAGYITDLLVDVGNPNEIDTIAKKLSREIHGSRVITKNQIRKTYHAVFGWRTGVGIIALLGSVAAFVILAWDKATGLSMEDRREAGILKALGWQVRDIMLVRFYESGVLATLAFSSGYTLAWVHVTFYKALLLRPLLLGWSVLQPELSVVPVFNLYDFSLILTLSVVPYWCATIIPAWRSGMARAETVI